MERDINVSSNKPPIGIEPRWSHSCTRLDSIVKAVRRYIDAGLEIPVEWIEEYNELNEKYGHYPRT